jgi:2'-5' RNA ligase
MPFAVQLYFDQPLEEAFLHVRAGLTNAGVTPTLKRLGDRPHVSLSVQTSLQPARLLPRLEKFAAATAPFEVSFGAFGSFPGREGVVFLAPAPTEALLRAQKKMHDHLLASYADAHEHYFSKGWVPHSTVGFELPQRGVAAALAWLGANFKPFAGRFTRIGLIEFRPVKVIATFPLGAQASG